MNNIGVYIHIPFCINKCSYCDFNSYDNKAELIPSYINALKTEIISRAKDLQNFKIISVFLGGGTPSLIKAETLTEILHTFRLNINTEITIEINPGKINENYLFKLFSAGFNRISIGAQSFNKKYLNLLGRSHTVKNTYSLVHQSRLAGFNNISIDMIFGIPGETTCEWLEDLNRAIDLGPDHISTYNLTVEEGTVLCDAVKAGRFTLPSDLEQVKMYEAGIELLDSKGYNHYEISNFCKENKECIQNRLYWKNREYMGFGAGACSYVDGERTGNIKSPEEYIHLFKTNKNVIQFRERLIRKKAIRETVVMGLRMMEGIEMAEFKTRFGEDIHDILGMEIDLLINEDLLIAKDGRIRLSRKGIIFSNNVFMEFV